MDERDFELLQVLNETKNVTKAAALLYMTQSALSKRISAINDELKTKIVLSSRKGIVFTPEGEIVLEQIKKAASELRNMRDMINANSGYVGGSLNIGVSTNYAIYLLPEILYSYREKYPQVTTNITTDHSRKLYTSLTEGKIDAAILRGEYPWTGNKHLVRRESVCAIFHEKYQNQSLKLVPYLGRRSDAVFEREIAYWLRENDIAPEPKGIYLDSITTCVEMVKRGIGWAIVPEICLVNFPGIVQPLFFKNGEPFIRSTYVMHSEAVGKLPQVQAFVDLIKDY